MPNARSAPNEQLRASAWIPDATALATFRRNPEAFRLRHRLGLVPAMPEAKPRAGSALHVALDLWFGDHGLPAALAGMQALFEQDDLGTALDPRAVRPLSHLERVVAAYAATYPRAADPFTVTATERYVEARIEADGVSFDYCGIIDRVVRFADDSYYVMDAKSTGSYLTQKFFEPLTTSDQLVGYVALERAAGRRCDGFYVDAIHLNDKTQLVGPDDFERWGPVSVPDWRIARWARDVRWTLDEIARLEAGRGLDKPWPVYQNWTYGKPDAYWDFYVYPEEMHASLASQFVREAWKPVEVAEARMRAKLLARLAVTERSGVGEI